MAEQTFQIAGNKDIHRAFYEGTGYVMDTHTAVAYAAYKKYQAEKIVTWNALFLSYVPVRKKSYSTLLSLDAQTKCPTGRRKYLCCGHQREF